MRKMRVRFAHRAGPEARRSQFEPNIKSNERSRFRFPLEPLLWVLVLGFVGYRAWPQLAAALDVGTPGAEAPSFTLQTLEGETVTLEDLKGRVVLVNFWATWCPPCRVEMPGFERVYRDRKDDGFTIVAVSTDRTGANVVWEFLASRELTFPAAMATGRIVRDYGGVRALPTSFLIDREGRIRHEVRGLFAEPALRMAVDRLLAEPVSGAGAP